VKPNCAADLRLVPHYIAPSCPTCGSRLVLDDVLGDDPFDADLVWWDEWTCPTTTCERGTFMDWPVD